MKDLLDKHIVFKIVLLITPLLSALLLIIGIYINDYVMLYFSVLFLYIALLILCISNWKNRLCMIFFLGMFFLFILGNPSLTILTGKSFDKIFNKENISFGFYCVYASLLGFYFYYQIIYFKKNTFQNTADLFHFSFNLEFMKKFVILPMLLFSGISLASLGIEQINFISSHTYTEYYTLFSSRLPAVIRLFVQFWLLSVCFYLATKPSLNKTYGVLFLNLLLNVPSFIVGMRSPLMINAVFSILYICLRVVYDNKKFNRKVIITGILFVPILMIALSIYGVSRNGIKDKKVFDDPISKFIIDQGHMFDIIAESNNLLPQLPDNGLINYIIGPVYDTAVNNPITRAIFNKPSIGNQNEDALSYSHNMKIQLSYLFYGDKFFDGLGVGSSYILEAYATWGYFGIFLWSILIAFFCDFSNWSLKFRNKFFINGMNIYILSQILYTPRANALLPFVQINHILVFILLLFFAQNLQKYLLKRRESLNECNK